MVPKIDLSTIPKTVFWAAIAVFTIVTLSMAYLIVGYKAIKPYQKHLEIDCIYTNNTIVTILTAKTDIYNISIQDFDGNLGCYISNIYKDSMDGCKFNARKIGNIALIKVKYYTDNKTLSAVKSCEVVEKRSLLDLFR